MYAKSAGIGSAIWRTFGPGVHLPTLRAIYPNRRLKWPQGSSAVAPPGWRRPLPASAGAGRRQPAGPRRRSTFGVILRKAWGGSRAWAGARAQAVLMSVWRTHWQHGRLALDFLSQLLRGAPTALALPPRTTGPFRLRPPAGRRRIPPADRESPEARVRHGRR
jgi:hypothetical protein